ncbi:hypothetical protein SteCoe_6621 [Stentor coeruleus]|uniref:Uncharacterized protein n=1 Tax=Stentor coeruleus TaxID=5963 RepID=A0A1R2CPP0_9CILI|nr:hypothetical protein SteCoe_6621 [Stentor coeruleus]
MFIKPGDPKANLTLKKLELFLSFAFTMLALSFMITDAYAYSQNLISTNKIVGVKESPYFPGKNIDSEDGQLRIFLECLPVVLMIAISFIILRRGIFYFSQSKILSIYFYIVFGIAFGIFLHTAGICFLLALILCNYVFAKILARNKFFPILVWIGNLAFLLLAEYYDGFRFAWFNQSLGFLDDLPQLLKWHRVNNLCMLKIISFMMDYHWKLTDKLVPTHEKHIVKCDECSEKIFCLKYRAESHAEIYTLASFLAYTLYAPLYLAGPTTTYNSWISQVYLPQQTISSKNLIIYILRFLGTFLVLLWFIHNLYFPTIASNIENRNILLQMTPYELIIASYFILKWIWLKFIVIWRFFRIWALFDGIESPENMGRCMSNNYCFEGFWRMWHRAFNQWLIRYLFIPLGGSRYKIYNIWVVFGFVAIWHDLTLSLLFWGWGMCLFIMPEVLVKAYFAQTKMAEFRKTLSFSWMCAISGGVYECLMVIANLVGFSFGIDGLIQTIQKLMDWDGIMIMSKVMIVLTISTHFMMLYRKDEVRRGIGSKGF